MFFPEWGRQDRVKLRELGKGGRVGKEKKRSLKEKRSLKKIQNMNVSHSSIPSSVDSKKKEEEKMNIFHAKGKVYLEEDG